MQESLVAGTTRVMFGFTEFAHNIGVEPIPDLTGWQAYCDDCRIFRGVQRAQEWDVSTHEEYFDFVCNDCHNIVMSIRRANPAERLVLDQLGTLGMLTLNPHVSSEWAKRPTC